MAPYPGAPPLHKVFADDFAFLVGLLVGLVVVTPPVASTAVLLGTQGMTITGNDKEGQRGPSVGQVEAISE